MKTLEDVLKEEGKTIPAEKQQCSSCHQRVDAFGLVFDEDSETFICGDCYLDKEAQAAVEPEPEPVAPWETELGIYVKMERNRKINEAMWAVDPVTSPLSTECRQEWVDYVQALHRLTLDYESPEEVVWPQEPDKTFPQN